MLRSFVAGLASTMSVSHAVVHGVLGTIGGPSAPYDRSFAVVLAIRCPTAPDGSAMTITFDDIYSERLPSFRAVTDSNGSWHFPELPLGNYSLLAFLDLNSDGQPSLGPPVPEPLGWYKDRSGSNWLGKFEVRISDIDFDLIIINLWAAEPLPHDERRTEHGHFAYVKGLPTLHVWGSAEERGFAHGFLLGPAIRSFFRFFTLEASIPSMIAYEDEILPFIRKHIRYLDDVVAEVEAMLRGMAHSGTDALWIPELGRNISLDDVMFLNDYGCPFGCSCGSEDMLREGHCSQFAFWGERTIGSDAEGTIIGRNMDGENDLRKVTVSHFMAHAVEPGAGMHRYVHFMWPGFVGTASGVNEHGIYIMMNDGSSRPITAAPAARNITQDTFVQREILRRGLSLADVPVLFDSFANSEGGVCSNGCNLFLGQPSLRNRSTSPPALVYEGDRISGLFRAQGQAPPYAADCIMATNHYLTLGYDTREPLYNFGEQVYFSSLWRYEAGRRLVDEMSHYRQAIGLSAVQRLLQTVTHGTTEHSIVFRPDLMRIDVAVADMRFDGGWHAPYLNWTSFHFEDFFTGINALEPKVIVELLL